jgi:putative ABC transport system permease protein
MRVRRVLRISRKQLLAHKMRTALALMGLVVGVAAVLVMVALGQGVQREVLSVIDEMGTDLLVVSAGRARTSVAREQAAGTVKTLVQTDAEAVFETCASVRAVAPVQSQRMQVRYERYTTNTMIVGTTPEFTQIRNFYPARGTFFTAEEERASQRVAVLGQAIVANLFSGEDPIGEIIRIGNVPFEVIGVMAAKGVDVFGTDQDNQVFVPLRTALRRLFNVTHLGAIYVQASSGDDMADAAEEIRWLLRERQRLDRLGHPDDFTIMNQAELRVAHAESAETFTLLTAGIAGVSLLVGGIGILSVMLMTVRERRREVGLRMAVGAPRADIMAQFVLEASMLSLGGGLLGLVIGIATAGVLQVVSSSTVYLDWRPALLALGVSAAIGLFFGVYPAHRASRLDPIEALRAT